MKIKSKKEVSAFLKGMEQAALILSEKGSNQEALIIRRKIKSFEHLTK